MLTAGRKATGVRGAGFIDTPNQRITLQTEGQALTPEAVARTVLVNEGGASLVIGDVADVTNAPEPAISAALVDGQPGVLLMVGAQFGANTVTVTEGVDAALNELRPGLARDGITLRADLFRPAAFVAQATGNVVQALALGGVLVVVVLLLFLFDWRTALVSATAIPLSLLGAVLVLGLFGQSLNTMTLGGLAIAIGEVVDDAVIGVENVMRRLRENRRLPAPAGEARVVFAAILEVRVSVAYATFAVLLVFLPVLALTGVPGRLFGPLALAYILAVLASLAVALTVTPALARLLLAGRRSLPAREPPVTRAVRGVYAGLLRRLVRHPFVTMAGGLLAVLAGLAPAAFLGGTFLPDLKEGHYILHTAAAPGTSLTETLRLGGHLTSALKAIPGVRAVAQQVGRAEAGYDLGGTHESEIHIDLTPGLDGEAQERAEAGIRALMAATPGATFSLKTFLTERIEEVVSGFTAPVVISVYGADLDAIDAAAGRWPRNSRRCAAPPTSSSAPRRGCRRSTSPCVRATCAIGGSTPSRCSNWCAPPTRATRWVSPTRATPCSTSWWRSPPPPAPGRPASATCRCAPPGAATSACRTWPTSTRPPGATPSGTSARSGCGW